MLHVMLDLYGCNSELLGDEAFLRNVLEEYPDRINMMKVGPAELRYIETSSPLDDGYSGFVIIATSHVSLHTWAPYRMINIDVFSCGDWQVVRPILPKDIWVILYVSIACTFTPTLISVLFQKYLSPVTVSFIYILELVLGALIANLYLHEVLPIQGYSRNSDTERDIPSTDPLLRETLLPIQRRASRVQPRIVMPSLESLDA